ncbi:BppU family phage baseplate upper protein [Rhodobacterales bacterium HKCCE4037]|nr:BppU family phage baseplate upper protein [Rhodobacterales bacterium HKCCE4037]
MAAPESFKIKTGDSSPTLAYALRDGAGAAVNLTDATVVFHMRLKSTGAVAIEDGTVTILSESGGTVAYPWQAGDTDDAGIYEAEFEVTYSDSAVETFPNLGFIEVVISEDID